MPSSAHRSTVLLNNFKVQTRHRMWEIGEGVVKNGSNFHGNHRSTIRPLLFSLYEKEVWPTRFWNSVTKYTLPFFMCNLLPPTHLSTLFILQSFSWLPPSFPTPALVRQVVWLSKDRFWQPENGSIKKNRTGWPQQRHFDLINFFTWLQKWHVRSRCWQWVFWTFIGTHTYTHAIQTRYMQ